MILIILSVILFFIFCVLGGFHLYWLFGGMWGLDKVIPSKANEPSSQRIPKFATLVVAIVLIIFGLAYLVNAGLIDFKVADWMHYIYWIIPSIFIIRAIGEFKYVGFFKKVKNTAFAKADSKIFSPLCLGIGVIGIVIQLLK